jgi:hypothetical protein
MYKVEFLIGEKTVKYQYLVGPYTIGIITQKGKKFIVPLQDVKANFKGEKTVEPGTADIKVSPQEVVAYILERRIF